MNTFDTLNKDVLCYLLSRKFINDAFSVRAAREVCSRWRRSIIAAPKAMPFANNDEWILIQGLSYEGINLHIAWELPVHPIIGKAVALKHDHVRLYKISVDFCDNVETALEVAKANAAKIFAAYLKHYVLGVVDVINLISSTTSLPITKMLAPKLPKNNLRLHVKSLVHSFQVRDEKSLDQLKYFVTEANLQTRDEWRGHAVDLAPQSFSLQVRAAVLSFSLGLDTILPLEDSLRLCLERGLDMTGAYYYLRGSWWLMWPLSHISSVSCGSVGLAVAIMKAFGRVSQEACNYMQSKFRKEHEEVKHICFCNTAEVPAEKRVRLEETAGK